MTKSFSYFLASAALLLMLLISTVSPIAVSSVAQTDSSAPVSVADDGNTGASRLELMPPF